MSVSKNSRMAMIAGAVAASALFGAGSANALALNSWTNITNNVPTNVGSQLGVDVTDAGGGKVQFHVTNNVGVASVIAQIYFDDKTTTSLGSFFSLTGSAGVSFHTGANPNDLPSGGNVSFTADFATGADNPAPSNGINTSSEFLNIVFNLAGGKTFADVISQINSGDLVIGMHVTGIGGGSSDSYVNTPPTTTQVPEPATLALLGMGLIGLGAIRRRKA